MQPEYPSRLRRNNTNGAAGARQPEKKRAILPFSPKQRLRSARYHDISGEVARINTAGLMLPGGAPVPPATDFPAHPPGRVNAR